MLRGICTLHYLSGSGQPDRIAATRNRDIARIKEKCYDYISGNGIYEMLQEMWKTKGSQIVFRTKGGAVR